jgi:hypothetical protein
VKPKPEIATLALWAIAILTTLLVVKDTRMFTVLGPVYFVCMAGSIAVIRSARAIKR